MTAKTKYWKLGLFVSAGMAVGVGALLWLGASTLYQTRIRRHVLFDESVNGLEIGSPTKARGVTIGTVAAIRFAPDRHTVIVDVDLFEQSLASAGLSTDGQHGAPDDFAVQLASAGLTGGRYLSADQFDPVRYPRVAVPAILPDDVILDDVLPSVSSSLKTFESTVYDLAESMPLVFGDVKLLVERLTGLTTTVNEIAEGEARELIASLAGSLREVDLGVLTQRLVATLDVLDPTLVSVRGAADGVRSAAGDFTSSDGPVASLVADVHRLAGELSSELDELDTPGAVESLRGTLATTNDAALEVAALSRDARGLGDEVRLTLAELRHALDDLAGVLELLELESGALVRGRHTPADEGKDP